MKKTIQLMASTVIAIGIAISCNIDPPYAVGAWGAYNVSDTSITFEDVDFVDALTGWCVGNSSDIYHSEDGGASWTIQDSQIFRDLEAVDFVDVNTGWAVGGNYFVSETAAGEIIFTADGGQTWTSQESSGVYAFHDVCFVSATTGWAVAEDYFEANGGTGETVVYSTVDGGTTWAIQDVSAITEGLKGIFFVDESYGWAVGQDGSVIHSSDGGNSWNPQDSGTDTWLFSVYFVDRLIGWIGADPFSSVTTPVIILKTEDGGQSWFQQEVPATADGTRSVYFLNADYGYAVGRNDTLLTTTNGGRRWEQYPVDTGGWLNGVHFFNTVNGWVVGTAGIVLKFEVTP